MEASKLQERLVVVDRSFVSLRSSLSVLANDLEYGRFGLYLLKLKEQLGGLEDELRWRIRDEASESQRMGEVSE